MTGSIIHSAKRFVIDRILETIIPEKRLEAYVIFLGRCVYRIRKPYVIAITGSAGKSTTTEMIGTTLSHPDATKMLGQVFYTQENMNDNWGVAATLLRFDEFLLIPWNQAVRMALAVRATFRALCALVGPYPKVFVLECGVGPTANLEQLVTIAPPDIAIVTTIGAAHLEKVRTLDGVVQEKGALVRAVSPDGTVILGDGHPYVERLRGMARAPVAVVQGRGVELARNVALAVCRHLRIPEAVAVTATQGFKNPPGRLNSFEAKGVTVIDDTYNANPLSMMLGLDTLKEAAGARRKLAILGVMAELGDEGTRYHEEIGAHARTCADVVIGVGELARHYKPDHWFPTSAECADHIAHIVHENDYLFVKGSHSSQMWKVVVRFKDSVGASAA